MKSDHISVCICTFKRPLMLKRLLTEVAKQITDDQFGFSVVVADNDCLLSAQKVVSEFQGKSSIQVSYFIVNEPNISLARNCAVRNAKGNYIAFIDDDEFPCPKWLMNLYVTQKKFNAQGVLGPVIPYFDSTPPSWVVKSKICERPRYQTGTRIVNRSDTRTGNVLFSKDIIKGNESPFDMKYGKTGGEDAEFFTTRILRGDQFVWCDDAIAYETVPPERLKIGYHIRRGLIQGVTSARHARLLSIDTLKSIFVILTYAVLLIIFSLSSHSKFIKYLLKIFNHSGKILTRCGYKPVKEKP
jgi:succinoglycan biosynthesis protein ExoM